MNGNGRPPISRFFRWKWSAGVLIVVIAIIVATVGSRLRTKPRPVAAPSRVSADLHAAAPPAVKAPVKPDAPRSVGVAGTADICGLGKARLDGSDPSTAGRYVSDLAAKARRRWLAALQIMGSSA